MSDTEASPPEPKRPSSPPPLMVGPDTGPMDRRPAMLVWGAGTIILGTVTAFLLASGEIRTVTLLLLSVLGLLCLSPRRGIYILLIFLPFMYYLRRQVLYFNEFSQRDPILLFPPLVTIAMFFGTVIFYSTRVMRYLSQSVLLKAVVALLALFLAQVFNPLQGNLLVGVAGAIYFITPMLWVFFGLLLDERDMRRVFGLLLFLGTVTALYGLYQHYFGFSDVERYELEAKGFYKSFGERARVMSTFAGLGDFSVYMATTGLLGFAYYWRTKRNLFFLAAMGVAAFAMLWVAIRTSFLLLFFAIMTFLIVYARRPGQVLLRGALALVVVAGLYGYLYSSTPMQLHDAYGSSNPFVTHTLSGVAHPTEESTFQIRLRTWSYVLGRGLLDQPFGRGLGSTTTAAMKFTGGKRFETDSYFFEMVYGSSIFATFLFVAIAVLFFRDTLRLLFLHPENFHYKVAAGLMAAYFLGSVFGATARDSVNGPIVWLVLGWIVKESVERSGDAPWSDVRS